MAVENDFLSSPVPPLWPISNIISNVVVADTVFSVAGWCCDKLCYIYTSEIVFKK